ncbi:Wall-associated receptor kinase-like 22 [Abeliophyllum distichum]|uniref:Wall-associated receptor kinase-like 22 n=1 Tax=Abeliophyllum distichum TaxID=126358 RepID=A0ABD1PMI9_9LAMI
MLVHSALLQIFLIFTVLAVAVAPPPSNALESTKHSCQSRCGNIEIPYPFGIGSNCSQNRDFNISCDTSFNPPKPFLILNVNYKDPYTLSYLEVVNITETQIYVKNSEAQLSMACYGNEFDNKARNSTSEFYGSCYALSDANQVTSIGCDDVAMVQQASSSGGCVSYCGGNITIVGDVGSCPGRGCCRASISKGDYLGVNLSDMHTYWGRDSKLIRCSFAFIGMIGDYDKFNFSLSYLNDPTTFLNNYNKTFMGMPLVLDWRIKDVSCTHASNSTYYACGKNSYCIDIDTTLGGYQCRCKEGYEGNPYLGCHDINECEKSNKCVSFGTCTNTPGSYNCSCPDGYHGDGRKYGIGCIPVQLSHSKLAIGVGLGAGMGLLLLSSACFWLYKFHKKRKDKKRKEKFFKRNGGLLLQQQILTDQDTLEKTRLFTVKELEKATDNFNESRILGQGGQGTVYKGMLSEGKIVAIKKSKLVDENQVEQFINEVVMLSQIIHRNVVKLLGCCLETEVPLLVYEFIFNGTLYDHIHNKTDEFPLLWNMRLRIAVEVAEALAYLHSATSFPIYHRDVKSTNILLDEKYVAKVSDFGISRSITVDQTHLTTLVKGTFGYLDPEYFQSSQFTEKSDVYSFGVVLVELLTGQRPISSAKTGEERSLATRFLSCMEAENLEKILDPQVLEQGKREELTIVAKLAQRCLNLNGKKRPTMKEVALELEIVRMSQTHSTGCETKYQGVELCKSKAILNSDYNYTWTSTSDNIIESSSDAHPLKIHTV